MMMTPGLSVFRLESRLCRSRLVWLASGSCPPVLAMGEAAACRSKVPRTKEMAGSAERSTTSLTCLYTQWGVRGEGRGARGEG